MDPDTLAQRDKVLRFMVHLLSLLFFKDVHGFELAPARNQINYSGGLAGGLNFHLVHLFSCMAATLIYGHLWPSVLDTLVLYMDNTFSGIFLGIMLYKFVASTFQVVQLGAYLDSTLCMFRPQACFYYTTPHDDMIPSLVQVIICSCSTCTMIRSIII